LAVLPWLLALFSASLICISTDANVDKGYFRLQLVLIGLSITVVSALVRVLWILRRMLAVTSE
jgi:hypothetical protein